MFTDAIQPLTGAGSFTRVLGRARLRRQSYPERSMCDMDGTPIGCAGREFKRAENRAESRINGDNMNRPSVHSIRFETVNRDCWLSGEHLVVSQADGTRIRR